MRSKTLFFYVAVTNPSYTTEETNHRSSRRRSSKKRPHTPVDTSLTTSQSAENLAAATNYVKEFMNKHFEGAHLVEERQVCAVCLYSFYLCVFISSTFIIKQPT